MNAPEFVVLGPLQTAARPWFLRGRMRVTIVGKASLLLRDQAPMQVASDPAPIVRTDDPTKSPGAPTGLQEDAPRLSRVDVLVTGLPGHSSASVVGVTVLRGDARILEKAAPRTTGHPPPFGPISDTVDATARALLAQRVPELPGDFAWHHCQRSPPDQQLDSLLGDEWVELRGVVGGPDPLRSRLPGARMLAFASMRGETSRIGVHLDTMVLDLETRRCHLLWRGDFEVAGFSDLAAVTVNCGFVEGDPRLTIPLSLTPPRRTAATSHNPRLDLEGGTVAHDRPRAVMASPFELATVRPQVRGPAQALPGAPWDTRTTRADVPVPGADTRATMSLDSVVDEPITPDERSQRAPLPPPAARPPPLVRPPAVPSPTAAPPVTTGRTPPGVPVAAAAPVLPTGPGAAQVGQGVLRRVDDLLRHEAAPTPNDTSSATSAARPEGARTERCLHQLLWVDRSLARRVREGPRWRDALAAFDDQPIDDELEASLPWVEGEPRLPAEVLDLLTRCPVDAGEELTARIRGGLEAQNSAPRPLLLLEGSLELSLDGHALLVGLVAALQPHGELDPDLARTLTRAAAYARAPHLPRAAALRLVAELERAVEKSRAVDGSATRQAKLALHEQRRWRQAPFGGEPHFLGALRQGPDAPALTVVLPAPVVKRWPLIPILQVRTLVELILSPHPEEGNVAALRPLALARSASIPVEDGAP